MCNSQATKILSHIEHFTTTPMIIYFKISMILNFETWEFFFRDPVLVI